MKPDDQNPADSEVVRIGQELGLDAALMLLGIPVVAGSWFGMRAIYGSIHKSIQDKLESLLDRVEHNELT